MKNRNEYFDFLRGVAIIMVIGIHTLPPVIGFSTFHDCVNILVRQLLNCAVPLFLAISGFFIAKKDLSTGEKRLAFWKRQIPSVYIPCLVYSLGWFILDVYFRGTEHILISLTKLFVGGFSVYYFVILIVQLYFITPLLLRINNRGGYRCAL